MHNSPKRSNSLSTGPVFVCKNFDELRNWENSGQANQNIIGENIRYKRYEYEVRGDLLALILKQIEDEEKALQAVEYTYQALVKKLKKKDKELVKKDEELDQSKKELVKKDKELMKKDEELVKKERYIQELEERLKKKSP